MCQPPVWPNQQEGQGHCALQASIQLLTLPSKTKSRVFKAILSPGLHLSVCNRPRWDQGNLQATHRAEQKMGAEFREDVPVAAQHTCTVAADASGAGSGLGGLRATQCERCAAGKASVAPPGWIIHRASALSLRKEYPGLWCLWLAPAKLLPHSWSSLAYKSHKAEAPLEMTVFGTCSWKGEKLTTLLIMPLHKESEPDIWARKDDPDPLTGQFCRKFSTVSSSTPFQAGSTCHLSRKGSAGLTPCSNVRPCRFPQPKCTVSQSGSHASHTAGACSEAVFLQGGHTAPRGRGTLCWKLWLRLEKEN